MLEGSEDEILRKYEALVSRIARTYSLKLPASIELDDLKQVGRIGLLDVKRKYNSEFETSFETYAHRRISGSMVDYLRDTDLVSRGNRKEYKKIEKAQAIVENKLGRKAKPSEIAAQAGIDLEDYYYLRRIVNDATSVSIDDGQDVNDSPALIDILKNPEILDPLDLYLDAEFKRLIAQEVECLPEREKFVIKSVVVHDMTLKQAGEELNVSESRACQLYDQATKRILDGLYTNGYIPVNEQTDVSKRRHPFRSRKNNQEKRSETSEQPPIINPKKRFELPKEFNIGVAAPESEISHSRQYFSLPHEFTLVACSQITVPPNLPDLLAINKNTGMSPNTETNGHSKNGMRFRLPSDFKIATTSFLSFPQNFAADMATRKELKLE